MSFLNFSRPGPELLRPDLKLLRSGPELLHPSMEILRHGPELPRPGQELLRSCPELLRTDPELPTNLDLVLQLQIQYSQNKRDQKVSEIPNGGF